MPFITQGKTNWKFLLIVVVLAAVVGGGALWYEKRPEQPYQPVEVKKSEIANWGTYRNDEYGFEIKYPKDWQVEVSAVKSIKIKKLISGSYFEIIENKNENNLTLDEWFKELTIIDGRPTLKASAKETSINGVKAYKLNSELEPPNPLFEIVGIADTQKRIFTLYAYSGQLDDNIILEKMLSTFKFIEITKKAEEISNKEKYCEKDTDCACGVNINTRDCFYGNKNYVDTTQQCPDFCAGITGRLQIKCINSECKQVPITITKDETADWQTYKNEEYGFEIKYPSDYEIKEEFSVSPITEQEISLAEDPYIKAKKTSARPVQILTRLEIKSPSFPPEGAKIEIAVHNNPDNLPLNQWLDSLSEAYEDGSVGGREVVSVLEIESIKGWYGCCGKCVSGVFILKGDKVYNLGISGFLGYYPDYEGYYGHNEEEDCYLGDSSVFNQILSTFSFLE